MAGKDKTRGVQEAAAPAIGPGTITASMKVRRVGNSLGVILPREVLAALNVGEGDTVDCVQTGDGRFELTVIDREADDLMGMAEEIMAENRAVLRALAK